MTIHGTAARFYYGAMDMSGYAEQVEQQLSRSLAEYRPLSGTAAAPGGTVTRITLTGGALVEIWRQRRLRLGAAQGHGTRVGVPAMGDAVGRACYCGQAVGENQQRVAGDDIVRLPVAMLSTEDIDRCVILRALAAGGISPGATHDGGAASATGGAAYLMCTALSGAGAELTVTFEHSADGTSWDPLAAMTALTAVGSERKEVVGAVRQYLRVSWTDRNTGSYLVRRVRAAVETRNADLNHGINATDIGAAHPSGTLDNASMDLQRNAGPA